jgi:hypothetical protein
VQIAKRRASRNFVMPALHARQVRRVQPLGLVVRGAPSTTNVLACRIANFPNAEDALRTIIPTISIVLSLCGSPLAAPISSSYTCIKGHEQEATNKFQAFAVGALAKFFNDRGIDVNQPTLQVNVSLTIAAGDDAPYAAFTGTGSNTTGLSGTVTGTAAAKDGTKFNVIFSSGSDTQDRGEYRIVSTQDGFDREGNAINRHCRLKLFTTGYEDASTTLLVLNAGSGHVLGLIPLPAEIALY